MPMFVWRDPGAFQVGADANQIEMKKENHLTENRDADAVTSPACVSWPLDVTENRDADAVTSPACVSWPLDMPPSAPL